MDDTGRDLLVRGVGAAKARSKDEARFFLEKFLRMNPPFDSRVQAWRYLADISHDSAEKRSYLGKILGVEPTDGLARRELAILDGRLDPDDVVNPERLIPGEPPSAADAGAHRLACPQCGSARVIVSPSGSALVCEHCGHEMPIPSGEQRVEDHDFAVAMWTAKGHQAPEPTQIFSCKSCGVAFLLAPGLTSLTCPYCASVHVAAEASTRTTIAPEGVLPFTITLEGARQAIGRDPLESAGPFPLYLPAWMFSFAGEVRWKGLEREPLDFESDGPTPVSGSLTVLDQHALVPATESAAQLSRNLLDEFDLSALVPYDPRYLADRPAAVYQVTLEQASLIARREVVASLREMANEELSHIYSLEMTFSRVGVDSFKLLLLPFWVMKVEEGTRLLLLNGQTGLARTGEDNQPGLFDWLAQLWQEGD